MAKQRSIIKLEGTIGDITFLKTADGYLAKEKSQVSKDRISTDPAFIRTRENNSEFGRAGKAGKTLRNALRVVMQYAQDGRVTGRLVKVLMQVIKADAVNARGLRTVTQGNPSLLRGFEFNGNARLDACLYASYTASIDRPTGAATVMVPSFIPAQNVVAPEGTTHFKLVSAAAAISFDEETFVTAEASSGVMPWNNQAVSVILNNELPAAGTDPILLAFGIQFFQQVNGIDYPLKNGAFNALSIVAVNAA
ncbi:MAG: hypothetical protein QM687_03205 [Ferruginibacter sp.]